MKVKTVMHEIDASLSIFAMLQDVFSRASQPASQHLYLPNDLAVNLTIMYIGYHDGLQ